MNCIFLIQGEGRGHLTQAISLYESLKNQGFHIKGCFTSQKGLRKLRECKTIDTDKIQIESFEIKYKKNHSLSISKTLFYNCSGLVKLLKNCNQLESYIKANDIKLVINFYEPIVAVLKTKKSLSSLKVVSIGHQYTLINERHPKPSINFQIGFLKTFSRLTTYGSDLTIALSFKMFNSANHKLTYCPPLLRKEVFEIVPEKQDFVLVYLTEPSALNELLNWHKTNQEVKIRYYGKQKPNYFHYNFEYNEPSLSGFLESLRTCKAVICTAGFELISEALLLEKPVYTIPVKNHVEQAYNAWEINYLRVGVSSKSFDPELFRLAHLRVPDIKRSYLKQGNKMVVAKIKEIILDDSESTVIPKSSTLPIIS